MLNMQQRPLRKAYIQASNLAMRLNERAKKVAVKTEDAMNRKEALNIAYAAKRFALRATKAADTVITLLNDGTLKAYCQEFDLVFKQFCEEIEGWETKLNTIESSKTSVH